MSAEDAVDLAAGIVGAMGGTTREEAEREAGETVPGAPSVEVSATGTVVSVGAGTTDLEVSATGAVVVARDVVNLTVSGTGNIVWVDEVTTVTLTGTGNTVRWESGSPSVSDTGTGNVTGLG